MNFIIYIPPMKPEGQAQEYILPRVYSPAVDGA